jgi:hypothetical protein
MKAESGLNTVGPNQTESNWIKANQTKSNLDVPAAVLFVNVFFKVTYG